MKELPDEKTLMEMLEVFKDAENKAREIFELSTAIALKYENKLQKIEDRKPEKSRVGQ